MTTSPPLNAEIIVKEGVTSVTEEDGTDVAQPLLIVLCSADGFTWLSNYFARLADSARRLEEAPSRARKSPHPDPDDHQHIEDDAPCNVQLSDNVCIRVGSLTSWNRAMVLEKYDIHADTARHGSFAARSLDLHQRALEYESWNGDISSDP